MNSLYTVGTQLTSESNTVKDMVGNIWEKAGDNAKYPQLVNGNNYHYDNDGNYSERLSLMVMSLKQLVSFKEEIIFV